MAEPNFQLKIYQKDDLTNVVATGDLTGTSITGIAGGTTVADGEYVAVNSDTTAQYTDSKPTAVPGFSVAFTITFVSGPLSSNSVKAGSVGSRAVFQMNAPQKQDDMVVNSSDLDVIGNLNLMVADSNAILMYDALKAGTSDITLYSKNFPDIIAKATITVTDA